MPAAVGYAGDLLGVDVEQLARAVGQPLAAPAAAQPLARGLPADAHLAGGVGHADAGFYAGNGGLPPLGVSLALGCRLMGAPLCCESRQLEVSLFVISRT